MLLRLTALLCLGAAAPDDDEFFEKSVRPVLVERCFECHGDLDKPKGGLKLTSRELAMKGGDQGPAVVPGNLDESLLIEAVRYREALLQMPPKAKLPDSEIAVLERWVSSGAAWPSANAAPSVAVATPRMEFTPEQRAFWAFQPITKSEPPVVRDGASPRNDIDRFILARLEAEGLKLAPPAEKQALIRRATFDLTGLPPTPDEVEEFVNDSSDDAFVKVVDRLLASPAYGERWARHWLDVVRYADSLDARGSGAPGDILDAWRYRDWVVDAFNQDMPYDKFVQMQIAGDVLPSDDPAERAENFNRKGTIATTMLAIGNWGNGDADKDKILTDIADDQVDVVSKAFMGLTVSCARCHDHKFDPISQRDYYAMAGIFFSTHILPKLTPKGAGETIIRVPLISPAEQARRDEREKQIKALEQELTTQRRAAAVAFARKMKPQAFFYLSSAGSRAETEPAKYEARVGDMKLHPELLKQWSEFLRGGGFDVLPNRAPNIGGRAGVLAWNGAPAQASATANTLPEAQMIATFRLPARSISVHPGPASHAVVSWRSPIAGRVRITGRIADGDAACGNGVAWAIDQVGADSTQRLAEGDLANGTGMAFGQGKNADRLAHVTVAQGDRLDLVVMRKEEYSCDTTTVDVVISSWDGSQTWDLTRDCLDDFHAGNPHADRYGNPGVWSFGDAGADRVAISPELEQALARWRKSTKPGATKEEIRDAAEGFTRAFDLEDERSPFWIKDESLEHFFEASERERLMALRAELATLRAQAPPPIDFANAAQEGGVPESPHAGTHDVAIHLRGRYDRLGEVVPRGFPEILGGGSESIGRIESGSGRVQLARWLTSPDHPLTARVMVNRVWQHHFGAGLVRTPSNFGKLGERPTHPELLDYLARRLIENGWSLKALHREIMLSATYQQSSVASEDALRADADNRLFSRQNRRRLEAEALRDALLAVSGGWDSRRGGPAERDFNVPRRGLYMITIRSDRATFGSLFDQADSTAPVDVRVESTVAPQALYLMNSPFVREQSKALALSALAHEGDSAARVVWLYQTLFARDPTADEQAIGKRIISASDSPADAWAQYCHILLCSNEFLYVD